MTNLLEETEKILKEHKKTWGDVLWCGGKESAMSVEKFKEVSNISYDSGFGGQNVASDLLVVGKDFWLERAEYDGSEWWAYKEFPVKPELVFSGFTVCNGDSWATLEEMNRPGGKYFDN